MWNYTRSGTTKCPSWFVSCCPLTDRISGCFGASNRNHWKLYNISMKFGLLVSICAVGSLAQPWNANGFVYDGQGNMGVGRGNDYSGVGNRWVGNDNLMYGNANSVAGNWNQVSGRDNAISGGTNSITGKKNAVKGENNQVYGENNVVQGTGNIVSSGGSTDFDFEANLPKWMRSSSNTGSPQASTLVPSNPNPSNYNPYPR